MRRALRILGITIAVPVTLVVLALLASVVISPPTAGKKLVGELGLPFRAVVAHRGASHLAPEATAPAYLLAREMGADFLEADLQRTADGVIVVFHDDTLARTTNVADFFPGREDDLIETFTYEELKKLDAGSWFNEAFPSLARESFAGLWILSLDELIDIAAAGSSNPGLYLETKAADRHSGYEEQIVRTLRAKGWIPDDPAASVGAGSKRVVFQSFYPESLARLKALAPETTRVLLISQEMATEYGWGALVERAAADAQGIGPVGYLAWPWKVGPAHRAGLIVHPYVINVPWQMRLLSFFGADGFFTDVPKLALEVLGNRGPIDVEAIFSQIGY